MNGAAVNGLAICYLTFYQENSAFLKSPIMAEGFWMSAHDLFIKIYPFSIKRGLSLCANYMKPSMDMNVYTRVTSTNLKSGWLRMAYNILEIDLKQSGPLKKARVSLAQTKVPDPSQIQPNGYLNPNEKIKKMELVRIQSARIRDQLKRAMLDKPDFILFPELSIPWEMQGELQKFAKQQKVFIIGGLFYGPDFQNACAIFPPYGDCRIHLQYKLNRAPAEDENVKTGRRILVFRNSGFGTFACIICYDFTSLNIGKKMRDSKVNIIFLPTLNRAVHLFDDMATGSCYTTYAFICLCNAAGSSLGNSASFGPVRRTEEGHLLEERIIGKIAGIQEATLCTVLDVSGLTESLKRFKDGKTPFVGFITPPADFRAPGAVVSPFTPLGPAKENFVGREAQVQEFWTYIEKGNHVLILGPSGTGKTSLIYRLMSTTPIEFRIGFMEVYDTDRTFDFFRRLALEISAKVETKRESTQFRDRVVAALDDIRKTRDVLARYSFEEYSRAIQEAFHSLVQAIEAQQVGRVIIFVDQAERLAWLEDDAEKQPFAIKIFINIMRDLERMRFPIFFVLAIRQHDYDPLISLASNHIPARIVGVTKFSKEDAIRAVVNPLPPDITIEKAVASEIAELSAGIPFFVQLIADSSFKQLRGRKIISKEVFDSLKIKEHRDIFPMLLNSLSPKELLFVESMGKHSEYTIRMEDVMNEIDLNLDEFRHITSLLLGKNIVETLENDRVRFVHDQMKGYIQREWLALKMSNLEKLRAEIENAIQMLLLSKDDYATVSYSLIPIALCSFKSLLLNDIKSLSRILDQLASTNHNAAARMCVAIVRAAHGCTGKNTSENLRAEIAPQLEKNGFLSEAATVLAIEVAGGESPPREFAQKARALAEKVAESSYKDNDYSSSLAHFVFCANIADATNDSFFRDKYFRKAYLLLRSLRKPQFHMKIFRWVNMPKSEERHGRNLIELEAAFAEWAGEIGYHNIEARLLKRAVKAFLNSSTAQEEIYDNSWVLRSALKIQDLRLQTRVHKWAIMEARRKKGLFDFSEDFFALAKKKKDTRRLQELYKEILMSSFDDAAESEKSGRLDQSFHLLLGVSHLTEQIKDHKIRETFCQKAKQIALERAQYKKDHHDTFVSSCRAAATYARMAGDAKSEKKINKEVIEACLETAESREESGDFHGACLCYIDASIGAKALGDSAKEKSYLVKADEEFRKAAQQYERLVPLLIGSRSGPAAKILKDYFSEDVSKSTYYDRISSIIDISERFFITFALQTILEAIKPGFMFSSG